MEEGTKVTIPYSFLMDILGREPHVGPWIAHNKLEEIEKVELGELNGYPFIEVFFTNRTNHGSQEERN